MIQSKLLNNDTIIYHYSDTGFMIRQNETNILYNDTIDTYPCPYTYSETDIKISDEMERIFFEEEE